MDQQNPSAPTGALITTPEPCDLAVAVDLAERMLDSGSAVALREALRILLRAVQSDAVRRSVDAQFPAVTAFLATERGDQQ